MNVINVHGEKVKIIGRIYLLAERK